MVTSDMNLICGYLISSIEQRPHGFKSCSLREGVARWFFVCNITGRYTGSSESTMEGDLSRLFDAETNADFVRIADTALETYFPKVSLTLQWGSTPDLVGPVSVLSGSKRGFNKRILVIRKEFLFDW